MKDSKLKSGYLNSNDSMRNLAQRLAGGEMDMSEPKAPKNTLTQRASGGSIPKMNHGGTATARQGYAMGGVGKIRLKQSDKKGNPVAPKRTHIRKV